MVLNRIINATRNLIQGEKCDFCSKVVLNNQSTGQKIMKKIKYTG